MDLWQIGRGEPAAEVMPPTQTGMFDELIIFFGRDAVAGHFPLIGKTGGKWYYSCHGVSCAYDGCPATPELLAEFIGPFDSLQLAYTTFVLEAGQP